MAIHEFVTLEDVKVLRPDIDAAQGAALVVSANAQAAVAAPGILSPEFLADEARVESLRTILRGAVLRWADMAAGQTNLSAHTYQAGPLGETFTVDTRQPGGLTLWPSEEARIKDLTNTNSGQAFTISTLPVDTETSPHRAWCSIMFGSPFCSCGAILTNWVYPIYEEA